MQRHRFVVFAIVIAVACWAAESPRWCAAAGPLAARLPESTDLFVVAPNFSEALAAYARTPSAQLFADPKLQPFLVQIWPANEPSPEIRRWLGFGAATMQQASAGETALALMLTKQGDAATVWLATVRDRTSAEACVADAAADLVRRGGKQSVLKIGTAQAQQFEMPQRDGKKGVWRRIYLIHDDLLVVTDGAGVLGELLNLWAQGTFPSLAESAHFKQLMSVPLPGDAANVHLRWYCRPVALWERSLTSRPSRKAAQDLATAKNQGIDQIQAVGGSVGFATDPQTSAVHRTAMFTKRPYLKAMNLIDFREMVKIEHPAWAAGETGDWLCFGWDFPAALDAYAHLFDEVSAAGEEGTFKDLLDSLRDDSEGPQVDVRKNMIAQLGPQTVIAIDYLGKPVNSNRKGRRGLFIAQLKDQAKVTATLDKYYEGDPDIQKKTVQGFPYWEAMGFGGNLLAVGDDATLPPMRAVAVTDKWLLASTHPEQLMAALDRQANARSLWDQEDVQPAVKWLDAACPLPRAGEQIARTAQTYRPTFRLMVDGRLADADGVDGNLLRLWLSGPDGNGEAPQLDYGKLPPFEALVPYLSTSVMGWKPSGDGWTVDGVSMRYNP